MKDIRLNKTYDELYRLAFTDSLTGVYNRNMLEELRAELNQQEGFVTFVDVNNLKFVNDNFGHQTGDEALKYVARRLATISDYVFRLGGDEFLVLHEKPITLYFTQAAHGTIRKTSTMSLAEAMHEADKAMYMDKKKSKEKKDG